MVRLTARIAMGRCSRRRRLSDRAHRKIEELDEIPVEALEAVGLVAGLDSHRRR